MLSPDEVELAQQRLVQMLQEHGLGWVVRSVDEAQEVGDRPRDVIVRARGIERLLLLIDGATRALQTSSELEDSIPELLLPEAGGSRVHLESDEADGFGRGDLRRITIDRHPTARRDRRAAAQQTVELLSRLRSEALEGL